MIRYRLRFSIEAGKDFLKSMDIIKKILISNFQLYTFAKKYKFPAGIALPMGWASECEYLDAFFVKREDESYVRDIIEKKLPEGVRLLEVKTIPVYFPSIESCVDVVEVMIEGEMRFFDMIFGGILREMIYDVRCSDSSITFFLYYKKTPREVLKNLFDFISFNGRVKNIIRKNIYWIDSTLKLRSF